MSSSVGCGTSDEGEPERQCKQEA